MLSTAHIVLVAAFAVLHLLVILRALLVDGRDPMSRAAWVLALLLLPGVGVGVYLLVGEPWLARRLRRRSVAILDSLAREARPGSEAAAAAPGAIPERFRAAFRLCEALAHSPTVDGNTARLATDSNAAIAEMVTAMDAATSTLHVSFYIWLADTNGLKVVEALCRAARRGVTCRVIADGIGSRQLVRSGHWRAMSDAGVRLQSALPIARGPLVFLGNRVDLRNHRKIVVIDDRLTFCGSQNCADPEFRIKARFAPWVDIMLSFEGPVVRQNQFLFASDWMAETGEDLTAVLTAEPPAAVPGGFPAIAFGTGPNSPKGAMSDVFVALLGSAEHEVVISTPYFVPDAPLLAALIACARRGDEQFDARHAVGGKGHFQPLPRSLARAGLGPEFGAFPVGGRAADRIERRGVEQRRAGTDGEALDRPARIGIAQQVEQALLGEGTVHDEAGIALGLDAVGPVVVDAVRIEGDGGVAEQHHRIDLDSPPPRHVGRGRLAHRHAALLAALHLFAEHGVGDFGHGKAARCVDAPGLAGHDQGAGATAPHLDIGELRLAPQLVADADIAIEGEG